MYEIMSDLGKYLVNRYALCLQGSNMPRPPLRRPYYTRYSIGLPIDCQCHKHPFLLTAVH